MHCRHYSPPSRTSSSNSVASTSSLDMDGLPPRGSLSHLLNPVDENDSLSRDHQSLVLTWRIQKPVSIQDKLVNSNSLKRKPEHGDEGTSSKRSTTIESPYSNHITSVVPSVPHLPGLTGVLDNNNLPIVEASRMEQHNSELKPCHSTLILDPFVDVTFDEHNRLVESDRTLIKREKMRSLANGNGQSSTSLDSKDVSRECRTHLIRVETEGDAAYTRWDTSETSAFLNWMLGPDTKVRWDEFGRGDQGLYFEQAAQELFNGQRSKSSIRNKWDRMMNTYKHMMVFAEFTGTMDNPPNHAQLKKLLALARRKRKDVGPLTAHIVQQWYLEGWFTLCYSRLGKGGQTVVGKPNETAKKLKIIAYSGGNSFVETSETLARPAELISTGDIEVEEPKSPSVSQNSLLMDRLESSTGLEDSSWKDSCIEWPHDIDRVKSPAAHINRTNSELGESVIVGQSSDFSIQRSDSRRYKTLLALDLLYVDDEEIRSAARDRLVAEWRRKDSERNINYEESEGRLRLQIARELLRVGSDEIKEEVKRVLMSELK